MSKLFFNAVCYQCTYCPTGYHRCLVVKNILLSSSIVGPCLLCTTSLLRRAFKTWSWDSTGLLRGSGRSIGCKDVKSKSIRSQGTDCHQNKHTDINEVKKYSLTWVSSQGMSTVGWQHTIVFPSEVTPISTLLNPGNQKVIDMITSCKLHVNCKKLNYRSPQMAHM